MSFAITCQRLSNIVRSLLVHPALAAECRGELPNDVASCRMPWRVSVANASAKARKRRLLCHCLPETNFHLAPGTSLILNQALRIQCAHSSIPLVSSSEPMQKTYGKPHERSREKWLCFSASSATSSSGKRMASPETKRNAIHSLQHAYSVLQLYLSSACVGIYFWNIAEI